MDPYHERKETEPPRTTRRDFCAGLMVSSAGLVLAAPTVSKAIAAQNSIVAYPPRRIDGAEVLLPGSSLYFNYPTTQDPAVLLRSSDGEYRAYSRRCPHAGCTVEFDPPARCLKCPCHQGKFDVRMGHVMFGPPPRPLEIIVLQVRAGGHIWAVGKSVGRDAEVITKALGGG